ncbi:MAG TPA: LuxR C-terminal-related transcriptional regulator [Ktedonobacteraceae bacterium]|jgi:signal transduction histidine kinase/DNA-binding CsgD family transcriptional regulator
MTSSNAYKADSASAHHYPQYYSTLPEALYSLSCLSDLYEMGSVLGAEVELQELRQHILIHLSRAIRAQGACLLLYHRAQQRFIPVASLGERLPTAKLVATLEDWSVIEQQTVRGPGETLVTLRLDNLCIILVTLSDNDTLLGVVALAVTDKNTLVDERSLLLAFMGRVAASLLRSSDLSNRVRQDAISQERNRVARGLHDGIMQQITHVLHKLEYIQRVLEMDCGQLILFELQHVQNTLHDSLHELRSTMSGLLSRRVEKRALVEMIRRIVDEYQNSHPEIELVLQITGLNESQQLSPKLEMTISQYMQEALTNVWKHARATRISVQLHGFDDGWLVVEVSDNGIGLQPEQVLLASRHHDVEEPHFGLSIMRERIEEAGGFWELQSRPDEGTTVRARFPLANLSNELTKREHQILHLVSEGLTNREIAQRLQVSVDTVKTHMHRIMQKLGVKDRVQAVAVAYRNGWL